MCIVCGLTQVCVCVFVRTSVYCAWSHTGVCVFVCEYSTSVYSGYVINITVV